MEKEHSYRENSLGSLWEEFLESGDEGNNYYRFTCLDADEDCATLYCEKEYRCVDESGDYSQRECSSWRILIRDAAWCNFTPHETMFVSYSEQDEDETLLARQCADSPFEYTIYVISPPADPTTTALKLMDVALGQLFWWTSQNPNLPAHYTPYPLRSTSSLLSDLSGSGSPIITAPKDYIAPYIHILNLSGCEFKVRDHNMQDVAFSEFKEAGRGYGAPLQSLSTTKCAIVARSIEIKRG